MIRNNAFKLFLSVTCISLLLTGCWGTLIVSSVRVAKSGVNQIRSQSLQREKTIQEGDSANYAHYYIYRSGSFIGSMLTTPIYDNNEYIALVEVETFKKVDFVLPGEHIFTSKIDSKQFITFCLDPGKTYIIEALPSNSIKKGVLVLMNQEMIKKEITNSKFFRKKFSEAGLKIENIGF